MNTQKRERNTYRLDVDNLYRMLQDVVGQPWVESISQELQEILQGEAEQMTGILTSPLLSVISGGQARLKKLRELDADVPSSTVLGGIFISYLNLRATEGALNKLSCLLEALPSQSRQYCEDEDLY